MADGVEIRFDIPDFKRQLQAFGQDFERKTVRSATNAAAQVFKKAMIVLAPILQSPRRRRQAGTLKRAIYVVRSKDSTRGREHYVVSFRKGPRAARTGRDAFYGRFLEAGWLPRGPGHALRGGRRSRALQRSRSTHPKITKYAFIAPSFKLVGQQALDTFNATIEKRLAKENAKR